MSRLVHAVLLGALLGAAGGCGGTDTPPEVQRGTDTPPEVQRETSAPPDVQRTTPLGPDGLTAAEIAIAERAARREIAREDADVTSASVVARRGVVTQPNTGAVCDSGRLLRITLVGSFPHIVTTGVMREDGETADNTVRAVLLTADATSGEVCLIGVQTGAVTPYAGGSALDLD